VQIIKDVCYTSYTFFNELLRSQAGMEALRNLSSTIHEQARNFYRKMITLDKDNVS